MTESTTRSQCVTCGGPKVEMLPKHREMDECSTCRRLDPPPTSTRYRMVVYPCSECGTKYRGPKFREECCT